MFTIKCIHVVLIRYILISIKKSAEIRPSHSLYVLGIRHLVENAHMFDIFLHITFSQMCKLFIADEIYTGMSEIFHVCCKHMSRSKLMRIKFINYWPEVTGGKIMLLSCISLRIIID